MNIETLVVGAFETRCYLAWSKPPDALVIDPGDDADRIVALLKTHRLTPAAYLLTHGHVDHVSAVAAVCRSFPAPVYLHAADLAWAFDAANQMPPFYPAPPPPPGPPVRPLADQQTRADAGLTYQVISTPGHSPGSVCFFFAHEGVLFSGDTLFADSVGRTDLPGGDSRTLTASLSRLAKLAGNVRIYPGHGPATDMARERTHNFFLRGL